MTAPMYEIDYESEAVTVFRMYGTERADEITVTWKWILYVETHYPSYEAGWGTMQSEYPLVAWRVGCYRMALDQLKEEGHITMEAK